MKENKLLEVKRVTRETLLIHQHLKAKDLGKWCLMYFDVLLYVSTDRDSITDLYDSFKRFII